jgi:methanogenic corrinoid protein MtbC1
VAVRPRVDATVTGALRAHAPQVLDEMLADLPGGSARVRHTRGPLDEEHAGHARALGVAADLGSPGVFRAHAEWAVRFDDGRGLDRAGLLHCLAVMESRCGELALPPEQRAFLRRAIGEGIQAAHDARPPERVELGAAEERAIRGDRRGYLAHLEWVRDQRGVREAVREIAHVQERVGDAWLRHQVSIVEEHRASGLAEMGLSVLAEEVWRSPADRPRGRAVLACPAGEFHGLGLRLAAVLLELEGFEVEVLGPDTPAIQLAVASVERKPALVGISVSALDHLPAAREAVAMVRHAAPRACIVVAGFAARVAGSPVLGADLLADEHFDGRIHTAMGPTEADDPDAVR